jgi:hypothetical protein
MQTVLGQRIKIISAVMLGIQGFWNATLCCWVNDSCLHLQGSSPEGQEKFFWYCSTPEDEGTMVL